MYQFSYADVQEDGVAEAREREREAINHSISLLTAAKASGVNPATPSKLSTLSAASGSASSRTSHRRTISLTRSSGPT
jgi:hypothetical protein